MNDPVITSLTAEQELRALEHACAELTMRAYALERQLGLMSKHNAELLRKNRELADQLARVVNEKKA